MDLSRRLEVCATDRKRTVSNEREQIEIAALVFNRGTRTYASAGMALGLASHSLGSLEYGLDLVTVIRLGFVL
jgi:hypothetical protein